MESISEVQAEAERQEGKMRPQRAAATGLAWAWGVEGPAAIADRHGPWHSPTGAASFQRVQHAQAELT